MPCGLSGSVNEAYALLSTMVRARNKMLDCPTLESVAVRRAVRRPARKKPPSLSWEREVEDGRWKRGRVAASRRGRPGGIAGVASEQAIPPGGPRGIDAVRSHPRPLSHSGPPTAEFLSLEGLVSVEYTASSVASTLECKAKKSA